MDNEAQTESTIIDDVLNLNEMRQFLLEEFYKAQTDKAVDRAATLATSFAVVTKAAHDLARAPEYLEARMEESKRLAGKNVGGPRPA